MPFCPGSGSRAKYYWPLFSEPQREGRGEAGQGLSHNQQLADGARARIERVIAAFGQLPAAITARAKAIAEAAHVSLQTLYKHLPLWHPEHQAQQPEQAVMPLLASNAADKESAQPLEADQLQPSKDKELQTKAEIMKCVAPEGHDDGSENENSLSDRGVRGDLSSFPQGPVSVGALSLPLDEVLDGIQCQVKRLGWGVAEIQQFIADRFGDRRRAQLKDDELPLLLYYLRVAELEGESPLKIL